MNPQTKVRYTSEKDPEILEREINQTRAEMRQTLNSLGRKAYSRTAPGPMFKIFGVKGTEIGSSLGKCLKDNPMSFALTVLVSPG